MNRPLFETNPGRGLAVSSDARRAALVLHSLSLDDRRRLLAQLPLREQEVLRPLLDELSAIGMPAEPDLVRQAVATPSAAQATDPDTGNGIDDIDPHVVVRALAAEPPLLVAEVLSLRAWRWAAPLLAALPEPRRRDVHAALALTARPDAGKRRAHLLRILERRLAQEAVGTGGAGPMSVSVRPAQRSWWPWRGRARA